MAKILAAELADIPEEGILAVQLQTDRGAVPVAIVRDEDGKLHAIHDVCSHGKVALSDGEVDGCAIECWLHGSRFDLNTGKPLNLPATQPVPVYNLTIEDQHIFVTVP